MSAPSPYVTHVQQDNPGQSYPLWQEQEEYSGQSCPIQEQEEYSGQSYTRGTEEARLYPRD